jgi:hypothetical protein
MTSPKPSQLMTKAVVISSIALDKSPCWCEALFTIEAHTCGLFIGGAGKDQACDGRHAYDFPNGATNG